MNSTNPTPVTYSPFWPLQIFFVVLAAWMIYQLVGLSYQQSNVQSALAQLLPDAQSAQKVNQRFISFVQDLNTTSRQDPAAGQILNEFKIQVKPPSSSASGAAK
ncbi:MAG TPA: hypothetical protein VGC39_07590 [Candidatus Methylacidiphilales bacterium]